MAQSSTHSTPSVFAKTLASHQHAGRRRQHALIVLALRDEIQAALDDGWSRRAIWEALFDEHRVQFKSHAFLRCLRRLNIIGPTTQAPKVILAQLVGDGDLSTANGIFADGDGDRCPRVCGPSRQQSVSSLAPKA